MMDEARFFLKAVFQPVDGRMASVLAAVVSHKDVDMVKLHRVQPCKGIAISKAASRIASSAVHLNWRQGCQHLFADAGMTKAVKPWASAHE